MAFLFDTVEFFVLLEQLLSKLESFQSEVRKHILQLLKYTSNGGLIACSVPYIQNDTCMHYTLLTLK